MGCMYGPILYLVLPLGGLYLAADFLLVYTVFKGQGSGSDKGNMQNGTLYHEVSIWDRIKKNHLNGGIILYNIFVSIGIPINNINKNIIAKSRRLDSVKRIQRKRERCRN